MIETQGQGDPSGNILPGVASVGQISSPDPQPAPESTYSRNKLLSRALHFVANQARDEIALNLHATRSLEVMWLGARVAIALTAMIAAYSAWGGDRVGVFVMAGGSAALTGNLFMLYLVSKGKTATAFVAGFFMDNAVIFAAWTGTVWMLEGALRSNDIYLALFPILTLWSARLGFVFGIPYITVWLVWIGWSLNHFFAPQSYEVEQMPVRVIFIGTTALVGMWTTYMLRKMSAQSERRAERARSLQELAKARNEFISGVSHELRTPLTVIMGFAEVLNRGLSDVATERQLSQLKAISRNGNHLNRLVGDLLDLSRLEAGNLSLTKDEFLLDKLVTEVAEGFEMVLADRRQELTVDAHPETVRLNADRGRLTQVIMNLMSNASKYSPTGTKITLRTRFEDGSASITVEDEGPGISEEDQANMFTMFFRTADAAASSTPGNGIGLYLCKQIVTFHGGDITMDSELGRGTAMTVTLPEATLDQEQQSAAA